jgi:hypothetical protein
MSQIRIDRSKLDALLKSPQGYVAQDLLRRGNRVRSRAKDNLRGAGAEGLRAWITGDLNKSIEQEFLILNGYPTVRVGANTYYAVWVHEGTRRMKARPYLREALNAAR